MDKRAVGAGFTPTPRKWNLWNLVDSLLEMEKSIGPDEIHDAVVEFDAEAQTFQAYVPTRRGGDVEG